MTRQEGAARETEAEPALSGQRDVRGSVGKGTSVLREQRNIHEGSEALKRSSVQRWLLEREKRLEASFCYTGGEYPRGPTGLPVSLCWGLLCVC